MLEHKYGILNKIFTRIKLNSKLTLSGLLVMLCMPLMAEQAFYAKPSVGYVLADKSRDSDDGIAYGVGLGWLANQNWNFELELFANQLDRKSIDSEIEQYSLMFNGLYFFPQNQSKAIRPYMTAGIGWIANENWPNNGNNLTTNFGAGVWWQPHVHKGAQYFAEAKLRQDFDNDTVENEDLFFDLVFQTGVILPFGQHRKFDLEYNQQSIRFPRSLYIKPYLSASVPDSSRQAGTDFQPAFSLGWLLRQHLAIELALQGQKYKFDNGLGDIEQYSVIVSGLYHFNGQAVFSPFVSFGAGWVTTNIGRENEDNFATEIGFGVGYEIGSRYGSRLTADIKIRQDYNNESLDDESMFFDAFFNIGLTIPFGQTRQPVQMEKVVDSGVDFYDPHNLEQKSLDQEKLEPKSLKQEKIKAVDLDKLDDATSVNVEVRATNYPQATVTKSYEANPPLQKVCSALDLDCDGIANPLDRCANTPPNSVVDADGCYVRGL